MKQLFIINKDLEMTKGKIGVQTAHGAVEYTNYVLTHKDNDIYNRYLSWRKGGMMKKVVTKATEEEIKIINQREAYLENNVRYKEGLINGEFIYLKGLK